MSQLQFHQSLVYMKGIKSTGIIGLCTHVRAKLNTTLVNIMASYVSVHSEHIYTLSVISVNIGIEPHHLVLRCLVQLEFYRKQQYSMLMKAPILTA